MKKVLIDTNIWIDFFNKQDFAIHLISQLWKEYKVYSSVLTIAELMAGWDQDRADHFLPIFYAQTEVLDVSKQEAELGGKLRRKYKKLLPDMLIAATAILEKCQLVTRNKKDFPMKEIKFYPIKE